MSEPASARPTSLTGIVLAGGRSVRLGQSKPLVQIGGRLVLARIFDALKRVCDEQILVVRPDQDDAVPDTAIALGMHIVADSFEGMRPLGGLQAGSPQRPAATRAGGYTPRPSKVVFWWHAKSLKSWWYGFQIRLSRKVFHGDDRYYGFCEIAPDAGAPICSLGVHPCASDRTECVQQ